MATQCVTLISKDIHALNVGSLKGAPGRISHHEDDARDLRINDTNLDTLTEETESEEDTSLSDNAAPGLTHSSTLSGEQGLDILLPSLIKCKTSLLWNLNQCLTHCGS